MSADEDIVIRSGSRVKDVEEIIRALSRSQERPLVIHVEGAPLRKEQESSDVNERMIRLSNEVQTLKNQFEKYLKPEARSESIHCFKEMVLLIPEVSEMYSEHASDGIVFWIFYDIGDRIHVLEQIVEAECRLERVFKGLNFDYRVLPHSLASPSVTLQLELVYKRGE